VASIQGRLCIDVAQGYTTKASGPVARPHDSRRVLVREQVAAMNEAGYFNSRS
jgi:hypothetical protein